MDPMTKLKSLMTAAVMHFEYKRIASSRLQPTKDWQEATQAELDAYWVDARHRSKDTPVEDDPLYKNSRES
jgi:hypothetical protein